MQDESAKYTMVFVTCPPDRAPDLARQLVQSRLAACVNIIDAVRSIYSWEGKICDDGEALLVIKTSRGRFAALRDEVVKLHPYDVPEVVALPIVDGHEPYLQWVGRSTDS